MKSLMWLLRCILTDVSVRCDTDTTRDYNRIAARVEHEGISFLTITLPAFCKDFEKSLADGCIGSQAFGAFRKSGPLPLLFRGLVSQVFDGEGRLLSVPSTNAILCVRQICLMWKKVNIACSQKRVDDAIAKYVECDEDVGQLPDYWQRAEENPFSNERRLCDVARSLWYRLDARLDNSWRVDKLVPRHGPGATAERIFGNRKYELVHWHERLNRFFPLDSNALPNAGWLGSVEYDRLNVLEPGAETPVRVVTVPKTLKAPRVIAIEPVCMQYTQQALLEFLVQEIETTWPTAGHVNFRDQSMNQRMAYEGSVHGKFATLDLSDASDRVSVPLVKCVLAGCPNLFEALMDTRSLTAQLPDGSIRPIKKFASMGSATCFPVEAMVFYTIIVFARIQALNLPITPRSIARCAADVYVYGDDLIVPVDEVDAVIEWLEAFGLKVNRNKSFWTGKFRESCGKDYFDGSLVTPVYLREIPTDSRSKRNAVSLVSFANQLYQNGWWATARDVRQKVEDLVGPLPHVLETSSGVGWISYLGSYSVERWDERLQCYKVRTYALKPIAHEDPLHGPGALLKYFLSRGKPEGRDDFHKSVRRGDVHVNRRWVRPH